MIPTVLLVLFGLLHKNLALPTHGVTKISSDDRAYILQLSDGSNGDSILTLIHSGKEISHYSFEGEMLTAYWSPSHKYVAINNHNGHGGFFVWILSLDNGKLVTCHGLVEDSKYDRYTTEDHSPNLFEKSASAIDKVYHEYNKDTIREGYQSYVAYGWKDDDHLMIFTDFVFANLFEKTGNLIQIYAILHINNFGKLMFESAIAKVDKSDKSEKQPDEVKKTYDF